jgi:hypothetical protein
MDAFTLISSLAGSPKFQSLIENFFYFFVAWLIMRAQFNGLKESIKEVGEKLSAVDTAHSEKITNLENQVTEIKKQITKE